MTDSVTTNPNFTYEELNGQLLQCQATFITKMENKVNSIKNMMKEYTALDLNQNIEKKWKIIADCIKELKEVSVLLKELECSFKKLEIFFQKDNKNCNKLKQIVVKLSSEHESDRMFYNKMRSLLDTVKRDMIDLLEKELDSHKSIERQKVEDKILDEMVCEFSGSHDVVIIKKISELSKNIKLKRSFKFNNLGKAIDEAGDNFEIIKIITELLINQKEDYNSIDQNGDTVLHRAIIVGHAATVELILSELSKEDKDINPKNKTGMTPLHFAINKGDPVIIDMILDALVNKKQNVNSTTSKGITPLHLAVNRNDLSLCKKLLACLSESNQEINTASQNGYTPLHGSVLKGNKDIFNLLLDSIDSRGENVNPTISDEKKTLLHILAEKKDFKLFEKLLTKLVEKNEEINPACATGITPLHIASQLNDEKIVKLLIKKIKLKEGELSPKFYCRGEELTPFFFAAVNVNFNLIELFLKEKSIVATEDINPTIKEDKTLFQWAISFKKTEVVKQILEVFLNKEKNICFYTGKKGLPVKQICEAFVLIHAIENLDRILRLLNKEESFENFCINMLIAISLYKNDEMAERMILFLLENKEVACIANLIKNSQKEVKNPEGLLFLKEIKKVISIKQKRIKDIRSSKISDLTKILVEEKCTETLSKDKSLLESVKKKYTLLCSTIEEGVKCLNEIKNELSLEEKGKTLREEIYAILADYKKLEDCFLIKEKEQVQECLRPVKEQIQWSRDLLRKSEKAIESHLSRRTNNADLKLKIEDLAEALKACQSEVDKTHYALSLTIQNNFKVLNECSRALLGELIVFGGKDRENKEKEIAQKKQEEANLLEREIERITVRLSAELEVISDFIQESSTYFNKFDSASELISDMFKEKVNLLKVDLLNLKEKLIRKKEKQKKIFFENIEEKKILKDALEKEIQQNTLVQEKTELEWKLSSIRSEVFNHLQDKRKKIEKKWLTKVEEIQGILSLVLKHNPNHPVIFNKKDERYTMFERYKKHFDYLKKIKISVDEFDSKNDLSKEYKRMIDLNSDLLKKRAWLETKTEEVRSVEMELILHVFKETKIKIDDNQQPAEVYLPSCQQKLIFESKRKKLSISLLSGYSEIERANQIIELLDSDKNTDRDITVKKNALFLAIAMICESLKRSENDILLKKSATKVRDAIYHVLIEDKIDEEKYQQLMIFTNELCHKGMINKLDSFFNIFPKAQPDYVNYIAIIHTHIQFLGQYYEKIENNTVNIEEDLVLQSDIAFRLAQIFALQTDLSKVRKSEYQANKEMRSQLQEMFKKLNMKKSIFRSLANEVRHGGVEGVNIAINEWLMSVGGILSERSFRQHKTPHKDLSSTMARLTL